MRALRSYLLVGRLQKTGRLPACFHRQNACETLEIRWLEELHFCESRIMGPGQIPLLSFEGTYRFVESL